MNEETKAVRCEGWTRHGGAFSFGPVTWSQCENDAIVMLTVRQKNLTTHQVEEVTQPACLGCWKTAKEYGIEVLKAEPL